jgi:K+-sensing histidine kinase KdpD
MVGVAARWAVPAFAVGRHRRQWWRERLPAAKMGAVERKGINLIWLLVGAFVPFVVAAVLLPLRHHLDNANMALILVVAIVAVAISGRRWAAVAAALSAAASFDLFHTYPYVSLRITSSNDLQTEISLLVVGLAVGELAARGRRYQATAVSRTQELERFHGIAGQVVLDETADFVVMNVAGQLVRQLQLADCRLELEFHDERIVPNVDRSGSVWWGANQWDTQRWGLPPWGVALPVWGHGRQLGRFLLLPRDGTPVNSDDLLGAVALADQAGAALAPGVPTP